MVTLAEFFENESRSPNITQRKELLVQVNKVPGAEWYTLANVHNWFIARSKKKKRSDDDALGGTDQICMLIIMASSPRLTVRVHLTSVAFT